MIDLQSHAEGTILPVRAHAGARKNEVCVTVSGMLRVSVTQVPERGKANKAIIVLLAKTFGLRKSQIELLSGETNPQKRFLIREIAPEELRAKIVGIA